MSPSLGRDFSPREEHFGGPNAVLISDRFWRRRLHADPNILRKQLRIEAYSYTIIGVMPASFLFPDHDVDVWLPNPMDAPYAQDRNETWFQVIGRLRPNVSIAQARADLATVQAQLGRQFPKSDGTLGVRVEALKETTVAGIRRSLWVLFGSVSLLLLIACTNIAALLLARTTEREREIAVRFSLGASRLSIIVQLLTECLVLALIGCAVGLSVAAAGARTLHHLASSIPRAEEVTLDWRVVLYTVACAVLATLLCGLLPAIRGTRQSIATNLGHASRTQVSARNPMQWILVGVQVSLAVTLLVGAGLLLRSFQELGRVSPGFDPTHVLTLRISGNWGETTDYKKVIQRIDRSLDQLRATPGVRAAATSAVMPGAAGELEGDFKIDTQLTHAGKKIVADSRWVSNGYFEAMRIPLLTGEGCPRALVSAAIVNRAFANTFFEGLSPVGHYLQPVPNPFNIPPARIIGIAADAREEGLNREPLPTVYSCISAPNPFPLYLIRTQGDPMALAQTIRRKIHQIEPARSVYDISPLEQHLSDNFAETRLRTTLLTLFALTAVSLACVGLYGTLSYFVSVRKREIGLRLALGAMREQIVSSFLLRGVSVAVIGCLVGLLLAAALTHTLAGMLYGVSPLDFETFLGVPLVILLVTAVSAFAPALGAARVDAIQVLRDE